LLPIGESLRPTWICSGRSLLQIVHFVTRRL
jgi:hypothetical protein